jgi:hypothetical protein
MVRLFYKIQFREVDKLLEIVLFGFVFSKRSFVFFMKYELYASTKKVKYTKKDRF